LILPVGISFYTFQTLSYTIDVYRKRIEPTDDPLAFFAFVAFFPQLVAGPIERGASLLPQFEKNRVFDASAAADGLRQMLWGFFLKVVIADNLSSVVDAAYADPNGVSGLELLLATYAFAFQIYGDFAGYSHIAIGCARLFGFNLMRNFAYPYFSRSLAEFWHRWHISLSSWFRDYVYVPLGGSRVSPLRRRLNVLVTFVVSGLWHGAGFTFIVWGFIHGLLVAAQWWKPHTKIDEPGGERWAPRFGDLLKMVVTFHIVCAGWVFFRANSLENAIAICRRVALHPLPAPIEPNITMTVPLILAVVLVEWTQRRHPHALAIGRFGRPTRWLLYAATCLAIVAVGRVEAVPFIYFQF
jgi:D-alanyl-lipoteichoic acid acyltransferase DltB (MBOAT superfamily)